MPLLSDDFAPLDGNAAAGVLLELFAFDATIAELACNGCGDRAELGAIRVYGGAMGSIFRCARCDTAMLRLVRTPAGIVVDMRGSQRLSARMPREALSLDRRTDLA